MVIDLDEILHVGVCEVDGEAICKVRCFDVTFSCISGGRLGFTVDY